MWKCKPVNYWFWKMSKYININSIFGSLLTEILFNVIYWPHRGIFLRTTLREEDKCSRKVSKIVIYLFNFFFFRRGENCNSQDDFVNNKRTVWSNSLLFAWIFILIFFFLFEFRIQIVQPSLVFFSFDFLSHYFHSAFYQFQLLDRFSCIWKFICFTFYWNYIKKSKHLKKLYRRRILHIVLHNTENKLAFIENIFFLLFSLLSLCLFLTNQHSSSFRYF